MLEHPHRRFTIGEALSVAWEITKRKFFFFLSILIPFFLIVTFIKILYVTSIGVLPKILLTSLIYVISWAFEMGMTNVALVLCDGKKPNYSDLFLPVPVFLNFIGASLLYTIIVGVGLVLLIIPGIVWYIMFLLYTFAVVDEGLDPLTALKKSAEITRGHRWQIFGLALVLFILNLIGLIPFGLGLLVTVPMTFLALAYVYRKLSQ